MSLNNTCSCDSYRPPRFGAYFLPLAVAEAEEPAVSPSAVKKAEYSKAEAPKPTTPVTAPAPPPTEGIPPHPPAARFQEAALVQVSESGPSLLERSFALFFFSCQKYGSVLRGGIQFFVSGAQSHRFAVRCIIRSLYGMHRVPLRLYFILCRCHVFHRDVRTSLHLVCVDSLARWFLMTTKRKGERN